MNNIRDLKRISFRDIEQTAFRIACKTQVKAMKAFLETFDEEIYKNRDKKRYKSIDKKERTIDTILGTSVTFKRRYYKDRKTGNYKFLLDEALGLPKRSKQSPLACEIAIQMAVDGPSYRTASKSLERIFGSRVISHEGIRQNLIRASKDAKLLLEKGRKDEMPKEKPGIIFIEVDGLYASLQKQPKRSTEEKIGVIHTGWEPRPECRKEYILRDIHIVRMQSSSSEEFWSYISETLHREFEINKDTIIVVNGDRAKWIRMFGEWFCNCTILYQVDRFHLLRTLGGIFKRGSGSYYRLKNAMDEDPTGAIFMAALAEESTNLSEVKREEAKRLLRDLKDIADSVCDYRVRLRAMGYDIKGLRPMGAAEAQMDRFSDRIKGRGQSWSPWGLDAMMRLLSTKFEGRLEKILRNFAVRSGPISLEEKPVKKRASQVAKTLIEQYGGIRSHSIPVMNVGSTRSGGLSKVFHKITAV